MLPFDPTEIERYTNKSAFRHSFDTTLFYISSFAVVLLLGITMDTWANIPKAQDDPETIEQAIARLIADHEAEPTAHSDVGEAIDLHRKNDVIDHPAGSVVGDKFTARDFVMQPTFESQVFFTKSSTGLTYQYNTMVLNTSTTINTVKYLYAGGQLAGAYTRDNKMLTFQCAAFVNSSADMVAYFGAGDFILTQGPPAYGFKILNNNLYAIQVTWGPDGNVEETVLITGVTLTTRHFYRVQLMPEEGIINYYVDGELVATMNIGTNEDVGLVLFEAYIKNTVASAKILTVANIYYSVER